MKPHTPQSATSLPRAPRDEAHTRMTKYFAMMAVRLTCFILMVVVTPYSWYTWVFAAGAIFLPYFAVVIANVSSGQDEPRLVPPERQIESGAPPAAPEPAAPPVIRIREADRTDES
ncbi:DUF3099 domain-containing protein [Microbacterium saccharophilum]|uniref:DUF3099 domain-containing protein n=1 Tax=Microbacterium saccharophilum TaxID=1213358 RepID=A0A5C8HRR9_9MICO|nr:MULTISPECIES: DUF3099 domain-containing protein [Microbacterium]TXK08649.1 DUF3099 domain-containing protein [Microbacterium saccharophilum]GEP48962.1 hypothetical protein MSA03_24700 [Microbacterium saccharophilum]SFI35074.1 Protein of unknown function [Microbacterium saccharophilum]